MVSHVHSRVPSLAATIVLIAVVCLIMITDTSTFASSERDLQLKTKIVSATIYSGKAQITRRGKIDVQAGTFQLICEDLPKKFIESSLQVEGTGSARARIIGIDLRRREKGEIKSPRFTELKEEFATLKDKYESLQIEKNALVHRKELMAAISQFSLDKAQDQLAREIFSVQDWKVLLDFFEMEDVKTEGKIEVISKEMNDLYEKMKWIRSELIAMQVDERSGKSVVIDCEVTTSGKLIIDISYLVPDASWHPEYTIRYLEAEKEIELTYNAKIWQATGEDWEHVSALLSTAKPHIGAAPPSLSPHYLSALGGVITGRVIDARTGEPLPYANVVVVGTAMGGMTNNDGTYTITGIPSGSYDVKAMTMGYTAGERSRVMVGAGHDAVANFALEETIVGSTEEIVVEAELPQIKVTRSEGIVRTGDELHVRGGGGKSRRVADIPPPPPPPVPYMEAEITSSEFAANLQIKKPVDIETGAEPKRSLVIREKLPGSFSLFSVPRLSEHVYVEGKFTNALEVPLLAGISEVYIETIPEESTNRVSNFVGKERIESIAAGEDFTVHLGIDQDIKIEHKLDRKEYLSKTGKKYKKIRYYYVITVESFKQETVEVKLMDRIPVSTMKEVKVDDVDISPLPDEEKEDGIVTWKLSIAPGAKKEIGIAYTIVYPGDWPDHYINLRE